MEEERERRRGIGELTYFVLVSPREVALDC
jgi:hypothetical protein